jgi:eukaryotic-like serine/threonine-protein kinase
VERASQPPSERRVSHYRISFPLGRGGMGEVYSGFDETLNRRVAMKAIRAEHRLRADLKTRFLREARILSALDHPNICRVYDYIEAEDNDWLVLELVEGRTLRAALDAGLDPATKLSIAEQIAAVLVVTHAAGVVHRDLKPGNVMISGDGRIKVLDFGLARSDIAEVPAAADGPPLSIDTDPDAPTRLPDALAESVTQFRTQHGAVMGTVGYMSPEQAAGQVVTTASDMYSFGLVLQELFTGARADATLLQRPEGIDRHLAELIQRLKSTSPAERPTAGDAAARLRWIRKKPQRRLRALAIAAAILIAAGGAVKYTVDLARERTAAVAARDEADRRREQAESLIEFMLGNLRAKLKPVGRLDILDDVGAKATDYFKAVPEQLLSDTELLHRSTALYQIGNVRIDQGKLEAAMPPLHESLALATTLSQRKPDDGKRLFELGQAQFWVGYVHWRRRNLDEALKYFRDYLAVSERLVKLSPGNTSWQLELSYANNNIGSVLQERGDLEQALQRFQASRRIREQMLAAEPDNNKYRRALAATINSVAVVLTRLGRLGDALKSHQDELALQQDLVRRDPRNSDWQMSTAVATNDIGNLLRVQGMREAASGQFRAGMAILDKLVLRDPSNATWQRELGRTRFRLGQALLTADRTQAQSELQRAIEILTRIVESDETNAGWRRDLAEAFAAHGEARLAAGDLDGASRDSETALRLADASLAQSSDDREASRIGGVALLLKGDLAGRRDRRGAGESCRQALERLAPLATGSSDYRVLDPWARALACAGRRPEAEKVVERLTAMGYRSAPLTGSMTLREPSGVR